MVGPMFAQPATQLGPIDRVMFDIAGDRHVEQQPLPLATKRERIR
jgi:hypothetical protein